jgi:type I pantothenate kinase
MMSGMAAIEPRYSELADAVLSKLGADGPYVVGISGAVAAGKSTVAAGLAGVLTEKRRRVDVVATDAFLLPNAVLKERDLEMEKGFPPSFDVALMRATIEKIKAGEPRVDVPVYSHATYDIVPDARKTIDSPDVVIIEGVIALQEPIGELLDVAIYIDADEEAMEAWFVDRFLALTAAARDEEVSFYKSFVEMTDAQVKMLATSVWDGINLVNLHEHILPSTRNATVLVHKADDHAIRAIELVLDRSAGDPGGAAPV